MARPVLNVADMKTTIASILFLTACVGQVGTPGVPGDDDDDDSADAGPTGCQVVSGDVSVRDADELAELPDGCFDIFGDLRVSGSSITDLSRIAGLRSVDSLEIDSTGLTRLGFDNLEVLREVTIRGNTSLRELDGLDDTESLARLEISGNPQLSDLRGLSRVRHVDGDVRISGTAVRDLTALDTLADIVGGTVTVSDNPQLQSVLPLLQLQAIGGSLVVTGNPQLSQCRADDVQDCVLVAGFITIASNGAQWEPCDVLECPDRN
jgi:hypothetical protein